MGRYDQTKHTVGLHYRPLATTE